MLLEQATHVLDLALAKEGGDSRRLGGSTFELYSSHLQRLHKLKEEREAHDQAAGVLEQLVTRMALCAATEESAISQIRYVTEVAQDYRKKTQELVYRTNITRSKISTCIYTGELEKGFKLDEGPFIKGLDEALKSFQVQREAYYGGTFIGNHTNKCLKVMYAACQHTIRVCNTSSLTTLQFSVNLL